MNEDLIRKYLNLDNSKIINYKLVNDAQKCYRINIYSQHFRDNSTIPITTICDSRYIHYKDDGALEDKTIL